jgi:hypothetical protein
MDMECMNACRRTQFDQGVEIHYQITWRSCFSITSLIAELQYFNTFK